MTRVDTEALDLAAQCLRRAHDMALGGASARGTRETVCEALYHARAALYALDAMVDRERGSADGGTV